MSVYSELRKARERVDYCERELRRAQGLFDPCNPTELHVIAKLEGDLNLAQKDCAWAALQVEDREAGRKVGAAYLERNGAR